jgi:hypothetical protein
VEQGYFQPYFNHEDKGQGRKYDESNTRVLYNSIRARQEQERDKSKSKSTIWLPGPWINDRLMILIEKLIINKLDGEKVHGMVPYRARYRTVLYQLWTLPYLVTLRTITSHYVGRSYLYNIIYLLLVLFTLLLYGL